MLCSLWSISRSVVISWFKDLVFDERRAEEQPTDRRVESISTCRRRRRHDESNGELAYTFIIEATIHTESIVVKLRSN